MRRDLASPGVGLGLGGLLGALALLHPLALVLAPPLALWQRLPFLLGLLLVLGRGLLFPIPEPPYGARVEGTFVVHGGFTEWQGHRLRLRHFPPWRTGSTT
jgi:competence protein ComEC